MFSFNQACMIGLSILLLSACADIALKQQPIMDEALLDAINERELGQHQQALLKFDVLANQGNPKAIYNKGLMVLNGQGILDDYAQAQRLFESALSPLQSMAKQNDPYAQYALGDMYEYGFGTDVNTAEAARWYAKALDAFLLSAQAGDAFAQFMLAVIYRNGVGVDEDDKKVLYWLENSANQGYVQAQYMLGFMHREGKVSLISKKIRCMLTCLSGITWLLHKDILTHNFISDYCTHPKRQTLKMMSTPMFGMTCCPNIIFRQKIIFGSLNQD